MKILIVHDTQQAPDHNSTRAYKAGEQYEIGSEFMPDWLASALCAGGHKYVDPTFQAPTTEAITHAPMLEGPVAFVLKEERKPAMVSKPKQGKQGRGPTYKQPKKKAKIQAPKQKAEAPAKRSV